ncbi:Probable methylenetetrahydrofolate reductase, putative [Brugia malayi]|uniref:methylenetetrahydrofolate reductase (NADPH) n=2 Tax=Brugia TaxID=6278 RepID=A0A0I9R317_BRUMA|nr:putative methylenetetrahydrofolate reductase, putative [Brugia malayi]CTP81377.1 BMA-MTHF-1 [Brugia malayi]VIO92836.1 Probable methylenetetrahydrofolate reductase, putative [Brugia malayi]
MDAVRDDNEGEMSPTSSTDGFVVSSSGNTSDVVIPRSCSKKWGESRTDWVANGTYVPLRDRIKKRIANGIPFFSLEFFPPKTTNSVANFFARLDRFREGNPMFVDIAWHFGSDPGNISSETSSSSVAAGCLDYCGMDTMLHITCCPYTKEQSIRHLEQSKALGLKNILALRGDLPRQDENPVLYKYRALDLIRWIKEEYNDYFTIACAGYPAGHPEAPSYRADLLYLKAKVDAGADFIISQIIFDGEVFKNFLRDCREIGITVPIIPGILPIQSYESIRRVAELSQLVIPDSILTSLEPIKNDDDAVRNFGIWHAVTLCRTLLSNGSATSIHLFTLNREASSREILQQLGLWPRSPMRALPWRLFGESHPVRCKEDVRPIFWSMRPKSYVFRTREWDEFPNGRWGNSSSPAFNDLKDYYLFYLKGQPTRDEQLRMYGERLETLADIQKVFVNFITQNINENGVKVSQLPWNEQHDGIRAETSLIKDQLLWCNSNGFLTINSQPSINGAPSTDPFVGWGKPGGYCYQKAYLEFFTSQANAEVLWSLLPSYSRLNCHIVNHDATIDWTNTETTMPIAVTWGVFPGSEIAQPTVVDPLSFRVWKDEAFSAWLNWSSIYAEGTSSRCLLEKIYNEYCLVTLVDNDYPKSTIIFDCLAQLVNR